MSSYKHLRLSDVLDRACRFVIENPSIVKDIFTTPSYHDEPKLYAYFSLFSDNYSESKQKEATASGIAFSKKRALIKSIGEAIERNALSINDKSRFIYDTYDNLGQKALNLHEMANFIDRDKKALAGLNKEKINWIQGESLIQNMKIFVPAQLVYVPYIYQEKEPTIQFSISTGAAASTTVEDAICRGIFEIIERDSFMIHYLNKLASPVINIENINNKSLKKILNIIKRYKLEIYVINTTTDFNIPAVTAILIDRTTIGSAVSVGLRAGFNLEEIIINAIEESLMTRSWTRDEFSGLKKSVVREKTIRNIEDRARFWFWKESIRHLDFWLRNKNELKITSIKNEGEEGNLLKSLINIFKRKQIDISYVDITQNYVLKYGFKVVKVVIPKLQPLYLDEKYPYFGGTRLYNTPVSMGFFQKPKHRRQMNNIPHPIL